MKKILLPTDFSENSWNAIQYALHLFKDQECTFFLLNTYTPMIYHIEYMEVNNAKFGLIDSMKEVSEKGVSDLYKKIQKQFNNAKHTFSKISSFNTLMAEINDLHKGNMMDFIVMGTKGATGLTEVLFGSNTVDVIKNAKCPLLAVPSDFAFEPPHEILFPSDYEVSFKVKHIQPILEIASSYNSRVNILNASYGYDLSEKQEKNKQKLENFLKSIAPLFHSESNQNVTEAISKFQGKTPVNLLVMLNNKHSFFENLFFKSVIKQIGFHLNIPFLVIPSKF